MDKKTLTTAFTTFLVALLLMASVTFAWWTITHEAGAGFVSQVGTLETSYEFAQIKEGEFTPEHPDGMFDNREVIPGTSFLFTIIVRDDGDINGSISVDLTGVESFIATHTDSNNDYVLSSDYEGKDELNGIKYEERNRIQYAFSYSVLDIFWVPQNAVLDNIKDNIDQNNPIPTDEQIAEYKWLRFSEDEKKACYTEYELVDGKVVCKDIFFNNYYTSSEGDIKNSTTYTLLKDVYINASNTDSFDNNSPDEKSAFICYFKITYNSGVTLPEYLESLGEYVYNPDIYENQLMKIDAVMIVSKEEASNE